MNGVQPFFFEGNRLRILILEGEPWFVARDVCEVLNMGAEQIRRLDDDEKGLRKVQTPGGMQELSIINESGLYTFIIRSNKPEAKKFRKWFTSEVLPSIRKTGEYVSPGKRKKALTNDDLIAEIAAGLGALSAKLAQAARETEPEIEPVNDEDDEFGRFLKTEAEAEMEPWQESDTLEKLDDLADLAKKESALRPPEPQDEKLYTLEEAARTAGLLKTAAQKALKDLRLIYKPASWLPYRPTGRAIADGFLKLRPYGRVKCEVYSYLLTKKGVDLLTMSVPY